MNTPDHSPVPTEDNAFRLLRRHTRARVLAQSAFWMLIVWASLAPAQAAAELDCLIKPEMYVEVSSPVISVLEEILVDTGDVVTRGQPLARLEASVERARVKMAQLQVDHVSDIENRKEQLQYKKLNHERMQELKGRILAGLG